MSYPRRSSRRAAVVVLVGLAIILAAGCTWKWPRYSHCGNGIAEPGELCDATDFAGLRCDDLTPYSHGTLVCSDSCRLDSTGCHDCGNGNLEGSEPCDGSNLDGQTCQGLGFDGGHLGCRADCEEFDWSLCVGCGDGRIQGGEVCDDGNFAPGDGCDDDCQVESGWTCDDELPTSCWTTCGDGIAVGDEPCDGQDVAGMTCEDLEFNGGTLSCLADCEGFDTSGCGGEGCGNGVLEGDEECDDGAAADGDGCSIDCATEPGYECDGASPSHCAPVCGDGFMVAGEEPCDDGGLVSGDGCSSTCQVELGYACHGQSPSHCEALCGDGIVLAGSDEICDDGNVDDGDGCSSACQEESGWVCDRRSPTDCVPICGNGICQANGGETVGSCPDDCAFSQISAGVSHTCAVRGDGSVWCWGNNADCRLGVAPEGGTIPTPTFVNGLSGTALQVSAGGDFTCARLSDGTVWCWGAAMMGQLGAGTVTTPQCSPVQVNGLTGVSSISAGGGEMMGGHACAVLTSGTVWCWGLGMEGQLGDGGPSTMASEVPIQVSGLTAAATVAVGDLHTCATTTAGAVWCWGGNSIGQLGISTAVGPETCMMDSCSRVPVQVSGLTGAVSVSAGGAHSCAVTGGSSSCWGANDAGQLGIGTDVGPDDCAGQSCSLEPAQAGSTPFSAFALGQQFSCAISTGHRPFCWGENLSDQLGDATLGSEEHNPHGVPALASATVTSLAAGAEHTCVVLDTGTAWCWGANGAGQLGIGSTGSDEDAPVQVIDP